MDDAATDLNDKLERIVHVWNLTSSSTITPGWVIVIDITTRLVYIENFTLHNGSVQINSNFKEMIDKKRTCTPSCINNN